ncbi:MAG: iron ABC transporter permease, partial [Nonomuraea sp.]|nr:iron ABC transporter permease [Nonomuraea sp.]
QGFVLMLAPTSGVLNQLSPWKIDPFDFTTMTVVQGLANVTFPFLLLMPLIQNMGSAHEEAARASGASPWQAFRRVTLPMLWPGTLGVLAMLSMLLLGNLEIPVLFGQQEGRNIFSLKLWNLITPTPGELPRYGLAAAYAVNFLILVALIFRLYLRATRNAAASVTGKDYRPVRLPLRRAKVPVTALVWLYLALTAALPLVALVWSSITPYAMPISWDNLVEHAGFGAFGAAASDPEFWAALGRTAVIAVGSATLAVVLAMVAAYFTARGGRNWATRLTDTLTSSSLAVPATMAAFAAFLLFSSINRWIPLAGTIWALTLAYSYRVAVAYRIAHSSIQQINAELEDAARASGASRLAVFGRVVLPLLLPAAAAAWIQMVILGANEFTIAAFLATPESRPLSWYLYSRISPASAQLYAPDQGAAMAVIFTAVVLVFGYGVRLLIGRRTHERRDSAAQQGDRLAHLGA